MRLNVKELIEENKEEKKWKRWQNKWNNYRLYIH